MFKAMDSSVLQLPTPLAGVENRVYAISELLKKVASYPGHFLKGYEAIEGG